MTTTSHLGITLIQQSQSQKEVTVNTALTCLDAFLNNGAKSRTTNTPPSLPNTGDLYIIGASPTGAWAGQANNLAYFNQGWQFVIPNEGITLWVDDQDVIYSYNGSAWVVSNTSRSQDNRIINGDFLIDQRNEGTATTPSVSGYCMDMWRATIAQATKLTFQQNTTAPAGFLNSIKTLVATAYTPASSETFHLDQRIEGFNISDLGFGTSAAQNIILSFQARASIIGTYCVTVQNSANNRSYVSTYSVTAANTWTTISLSIPGDTAGTWLAANGVGIQVSFDLGSGSGLQTTAGAWVAGNYMNVSGAVQLVANVAATLYIANIRLYPGTAALSYAPRLFGEELHFCQRYYQKTFSPGSVPAQNTGTTDSIALVSTGSGTFGWSMIFKTTMRAAPLVMTYNPLAANANWHDYTNNADRVVTIGTIGQNSFIITGASGAAGAVNLIHYSADAGL